MERSSLLMTLVQAASKEFERRIVCDTIDFSALLSDHVKDAEECPVSPLLPPDLNDISFSSLFNSEEARDCQLDLADDCPVSSQFLQELDNISFSSLFEHKHLSWSQKKFEELMIARCLPSFCRN